MSLCDIGSRRTFIADVVLFMTLCGIVAAAPAGMPMAPSMDPFAPPNPPPPANYAPQYAPQQNVFAMPQQQQPPLPNYNQQPPPPNFNQQPQPANFNQQPQPANYNQQPPPPNYNQLAQYNRAPTNMASANMAPAYPAINQVPPPDAAPVGATAPMSSQGEMEFEGGQGGNGGGGGGWGTSSNYVYPPTYPQSYASAPQAPRYSPPSLLDAYYQVPYAQGQSYYQHQVAQRNRNDLFGGLFGSTPSGNMFGALMLNEFVF